MAQTFKIEGLKELEEALKELPKATGKNVLRRALIKAGQPIADAARSLAPRRLGKLQMSIIASERLTKLQRKFHKPESAVEVFVGPGSLRAAVPQEFGTAKHPAHPFMRPAWDGGKNGAFTSLRDDIADEIEKARARLARKSARIAAKIK